LAFKVPHVTQHRWQRYRAFPGVIDYCLCYDSVSNAIDNLRAKGLNYKYLPGGGRKRPDGVQLNWETGLPPTQEHGLPFLIEDVTPRSLRVPSGAAVEHPNHIVGIAQVDVIVSDIGRAQDDFGTLLGGIEPLNPSADTLIYAMGDAKLRIIRPQPKTIEAQLLGARGAGAYRLHLKRKDGSLTAI
jgi:hypothetical protein